MNTDDRDRLRRILATFDEAGLVALSNKGLVRRAQKDLEAGGLKHEETDAAVVVRGPGWVVTMPPDGPAHAADDTKASGVTRQSLRRRFTCAITGPLLRSLTLPARLTRPGSPTTCSAWNSTTWKNGRAKRSSGRRWPWSGAAWKSRSRLIPF